MMAGLRELLARHGRLNGQMIDMDPVLPSSSTYRHRFGGLERVYQELGYQPSAVQLGRFRASPRLTQTIVDAAAVVLPGATPTG